MGFWVRVFVPFAFGYFISWLLRSVTAIIAPDLVRDLGLSGFGVGLLGSTYLLAFALSQLPIGGALDHLGPRRTNGVLLVVAALGCLLFAVADSFPVLLLGRFLAGLGVAACLMASFKAFVLWAPPARLPFLNGFVMAVGSTGALAATTPTEWVLGVVSWRELFFVLAVALLLSAAIVFVLVPRDSEAAGGDEPSGLLAATVGVREVLRRKVFWSIAPVGVVHQGAFLGIQSLWAGPWLAEVAAMDRDAVATRLLVLAVAMVLGFLITGALAGALARRRISSLSLLGGVNVAFTVTLLILASGFTGTPATVWAAFGFFGASGMLSFAILVAHYPPGLAGRVTSALNLLVFAAAFSVQTGFGAVIDRFSGDGPAATFAGAGFAAAFLITAALQGLSLVWLRLTRSWRDSGSV
ncbi:MAG: MFS transporter [Acidobacteria bacterium]|nr:MFS transporter [Acidobacteriota bacterium]MYG76587.1 MFS transporter [Acidobacteriota bacterium]